jgi:prolyl 4-hydroxylase
MVVNSVAPGMCRKSCGACKVCEKDDIACYNQNRINVGFLIFNASELAPFRDMV